MVEATPKNAALGYVARHWSVIPLRGGDKRPAIRWQEYQYRQADRAQVEQWFARWPDANVGIVTGIVSGLVVLDVDPGHGGDESLIEFERRHGPLPHTMEARTGGGGRHLYFAHPSGVIHNRVGLVSGVDVRGDGGYVVAPPSLHVSGRHYRWLERRDPDSVALAALPNWLLGELIAEGWARGHPLSHWRRLVHEGVAEGQRNNTIASLTGHLLWHGIDPDVTMELLLCWNEVRCRPPLLDEEVVRTVASVSKLHQRQRDE